MVYKLRITPTAYNDLQQAIDYYNQQQKGLGKMFNTTIQNPLFSIKANT